MKRMFLKIISCVLLMSMLVSPAIAASEATDPRVEKLAEFEPIEAEVGEIYQQDKVDRYIVLLEGDSLVTYEGEIPGLRAANPHTPGEKLDVASEASMMYLDYLRGQQNGQIERIETAIRRDLEVDFRYDVILNGFAAKMTAAEAKRLGKMEEVKAVYKDELWQINTDVSPGFIGADQLWTDTASTPGTLGTKGEGMIVGILDTGINMDHPSFADVGGDDYDHENPFGSGNYVGLCDSDPTNYICNDKLIGVYGYTEGDEAFTGEDGHAHGSHTASTAAGNYLVVDYNGIPVTISGMAPHANIIAYDVCDPDGCANAYSTAAVQQAVIDGVDVINYSIGPNSAVNPYENAVEMAMLEAIDAGILTSTSAGNSGPEPSTVFKAPAWSLIVANSTHGRIFGYPVEVHEPGGAELYEAVALPGVGVPFTSDLVDMPIRWSGDDGNLEGCTAFSADFFAGSVALISRGSCGFVDKINNASAAGAVAALIYNNAGGPPIVMGGIEATIIPSAMLDKEDGDAIVARMSETLQTTIESDQVAGVKDIWADILNAGSSRGPYELLDVLVPEVSAPGTNVLAAYNTLGATAPFGGVGTDAEIDLMSGTSMASPHGAGSALLLMDLFPDWTPMEIKSAIMMSAYDETTVKDDGVTPTDPFDDGNGRIDLTKAALIGLVMDETVTNFVDANPAEGGDVKTLNIPSYQNSQVVGETSFSRTVRNVADVATEYTVVIDAPEGVEVVANPSTFTIEPDDTQTIEFAIDMMNAEMGVWQFVTVTFGTDGVFTTGESITDARFRMALMPDAGNLPALVEKEVYRDAGGVLLEDLYAIEITNLTVKKAGLTQADLYEFALAGDPTNGDAFDDLGDVWYMSFSVPNQTKRIVMEILETTAGDLDLFFGLGTVPSADTLVASSATAAALEYISFVDVPKGDYWVLVQNWGGDEEIDDDVTLALGIVSGSGLANFEVDGPKTVMALEPFNLEITWDIPEMEPMSAWYGWFNVGSDPANPGNIGQTELNVYRPYDDVTKAAEDNLEYGYEALTYTITIAPNETGEDLSYVIQDVLPEDVTYIDESLQTIGSDVDATYDALTKSINWEGTIPKIEYTYLVTDSTTNPACSTPFGGYVNLEAFGILAQPSISGDSFAFGAPFISGTDFYGTPTNTSGVFTDDGYILMSTENLAFDYNHQNIPDPTPPNGLIAGWWRDMWVTYDADLNKGVSLATFGPGWLIEYDDSESYENPNLTLDYEIIAYYEADPSVGRPDIMVAFDNVIGDWGMKGSVGVEDYTGTLGTNYAYNNFNPQDGLIVCFDYTQAGADPVVITFDVTVDIYDEVEITNTVLHTADGLGMKEEEASATILVNTAKAFDDFYETGFETVLIVETPGVMENDKPADGDDIAFVELKDGPLNGDVILSEDGSFEYTPDNGFRGDDSFTYTLFNTPTDLKTSRSAYSDEATVTITVNDKPVANDNTITTDEDVPVDITLTADYLLPGPVVWTLETQPLHGTLSGTVPNLVYTPDLDWYGEDGFTFSVNDGMHDSNVATITIEVTPVNDGPIAVDDAYDTDQDTQLVVSAPGVLENDIEVDPTDEVYADLKDGPMHGTLELDEDGSFTYTPDEGFFGQDSFTYFMLGIPVERAEYADEATVTITVHPFGTYFFPMIKN